MKQRRIVWALVAGAALAAGALALPAAGSERATSPFSPPPAGWVVVGGDMGSYAVHPDWSGLRTVRDWWGIETSPDGRWTAVPGPHRRDLRLRPRGGDDSSFRQLARGIYGGGVSWAPDAKRLVFAGTAGGLWVVGVDGRGPRRILRLPEGISFPAWSPDGKRIAFSVGERLWVVRSDGRYARPVGDAVGYGVRWAPDARRLALIDSDALFMRVVDVDRRTSRTVFVLPARHLGELDAEYLFSLAWSPDGRFLAAGSSSEFACDEDSTGPCYDQAYWIVDSVAAVGRLAHVDDGLDDASILGWRTTLP